MKSFLIPLFLIITCYLHRTIAIKCYTCIACSTVSSSQSLDCENSSSQCYKDVGTASGVTVYNRGCIETCVEAEMTISNLKYNRYCCSGDNCIEADLCLNLPESEDVNAPDELFNPNEYGLDEITTRFRIDVVEEMPTDHIIKNANALLGIRESFWTNQARQAKSMKTRSKRYIPEVSIGDYVALPIPDVDKGLREAPNLICRIVDIDYSKSFYELACEAVVLNVLFARNGFDLVKECSVELDIKLDKQLSVREAVKELSIGGGQGKLKCNCTTGCLTNRCTCKMAGVLCNSRCHGGKSNFKNK
ncbi:KRAB-A domain-containing 2-like [Brachionus plicatilis]|uniref:KRAB-A domain-containing 2-like n=1 Tax=Brachionus plicatilis TaxID=10195 RepID=A0A3M7QI70_BRAPC|nr:KRAB-A domain-containing 2-like [Brachionus plicatilis]